MKKKLLFLLIIITGINCYSQISYEKGYYIDNSNQKINCLIKNFDWNTNPVNFEYKLLTTSKSKNFSIKSIKEFGIYNVSKYIRKIVQLDTSSDNINKLGKNKNPLFKEKQLFLKVLVKGKANLFSYNNGNLRRYFYNKENSNIKPLVFKKYITFENKLGKNNQFKQQLWNNLKCSTIKIDKIKKLEYVESSLIKLFIEYNKCSNSNFVSYENKQKKDLFNLTFRPRLNNSSLTVQNAFSNSRDTDFGNKTGFGFGIEAEYILPFNKNKWAISIELTYQSFESEKTTNVNYVSGGKLVAQVFYSSIEIPISLRHYFFLNNNSKIFVNISYIYDLNSKSSLEFKRADNSSLSSLNLEGTGNELSFGAGYKFNDRYSLEIRHLKGRETLIGSKSWSSDYKTFSIILGYSIF